MTQVDRQDCAQIQQNRLRHHYHLWEQDDRSKGQNKKICSTQNILWGKIKKNIDLIQMVDDNWGPCGKSWCPRHWQWHLWWSTVHWSSPQHHLNQMIFISVISMTLLVPKALASRFYGGPPVHPSTSSELRIRLR